MEQTVQLTAPVIQENVLLMDIPTVKWDGLEETVTMISMNAIGKRFVVAATVQTLLVVFIVPVRLLYTV